VAAFAGPIAAQCRQLPFCAPPAYVATTIRPPALIIAAASRAHSRIAVAWEASAVRQFFSGILVVQAAKRSWPETSGASRRSPES
jgi:hypothetical protein